MLVFIREDALEARKLIYGIVGANLVMTLVPGKAACSCATPAPPTSWRCRGRFDQGARSDRGGHAGVSSST
jgi:hypothetical protein